MFAKLDIFCLFGIFAEIFFKGEQFNQNFYEIQKIMKKFVDFYDISISKKTLH